MSKENNPEVVSQTIPLLRWQQVLLIVVSLIIVSIGQPTRCWWCGILAAVGGFALFWRALLSIESQVQRFWIATLWGTAVHATQISWFIDHPFWYIYAIWIIFSLGCGLQFAIVSLLVTPERIRQFRHVLVIAAAWTLMEWLRLYFMSGYTWNPVGLALTSHLYPLQFATLWGMFGLSFWVIFVNLLLLYAWIHPQKRGVPITGWLVASCVPFIFGYFHYSYHEKAFAQQQATDPKHMSVVLVQTAFAPEEPIAFNDLQSAIGYVVDEWRQILKIISKQVGQKIDLMVFPEYTVPYGTYSPIYPYTKMKEMFQELYGEHILAYLPPLEEPWATFVPTHKGGIWLVDNAFMAQAISNIFQTDVLIGLEDVDKKDHGMVFYSAAVRFHPNAQYEEERYEKRVLVPMAEYIPFSFCKAMCETYGVTGSFTPGQQAKIFHTAKSDFGCCICYEETFGNLMRQSRQLGANLLVNLTNDAWYPNSLLPQQHLDHAIPRTVENGVPLVRACNTGITCAVDSLGRVVSALGDGDPKAEWLADSTLIQVPLYSYHTLYTRWGDIPVIVVSFALALAWFVGEMRRKKEK